jgi:hypothetical protein
MFIVVVYFVIDSFRKLLDTSWYKNQKIKRHETTVSLLVLYWFETWCLPLRKELSLRVLRRDSEVNWVMG